MRRRKKERKKERRGRGRGGKKIGFQVVIHAKMKKKNLNK